MTSVLTKAGGFVAIIILGWILRRKQFFKENDYRIIMKIVLNITLPASIVYSYAGKEIDLSMLFLAFLGFALGLVHMAAGFAFSGSREKSQRAFSLLNISGYNIGNFTLPFAQGLLGAEGVIATSLFGIGNSFICLGIACTFAGMIQHGERFSWMKMLKDLFHSVPFDAYLIMAILALAHIQLPNPVTELAGVIGGANTFLAMLMLGVCFRLDGNWKQIGSLVRLLSVNYGIAVLAAICCYTLLPMSAEIRKALVILVFSPITSNAVAYTEKLKGDVGLASAVNSMSILISLICMVLLCVFL